MATWAEVFAGNRLLVTDGSWGTELAARGLRAGEAPERWNLDHPDVVRGIAADYVAAGSDIVLTNTFGGNRIKWARSGLADEVERVNRVGVELSKAAAGEGALVFASVGPTGEFMAPLGTATEADIAACFAEQVRTLAAAGVDGIVIETMIDVKEAAIAVRAVKEHTGLPAAACMTFERGPAGYFTIMGVSPEQAAADLEAAGADIIGSNCGTGIDTMVEVIRVLRGATAKPLWAKPNAGLPELLHGETVFRETPEQMAAGVGDLVAAGASHVGGCCGTTPEHLRRIAEAVHSLATGA